MYNAHLLDHKVLLNPIREEAIFSNPIHSRYLKLNANYLSLIIQSNIKQLLHYSVGNFNDLDLDFEQILAMLDDNIAEEVRLNTSFELDKEHLYLVNDFFSQLEDIQRCLDCLKIPLEKVSSNGVEYLEDKLEFYLGLISRYNTAFDFYTQEIDSDNFLFLQIKSVADIFYLLVASIDAYLGGKIEDLILMAQETSLFCLYYLRNFLEIVKEEHISLEDLSQEKVIDIELTRQWDVYRAIQNVVNGKLALKAMLEKVATIDEKAIKQYNKVLNQEFL
ncbi:hypothetical protein CKF54_03585 [Psittacicella hinzii]|uniref:Uncharacterized protein n=1 Tax=Psittacicella hinzii TaxID=2028575 RepID=A0A3A1Y799_9GAMM|nr:hypothetical protein [Psittacicella hinzii]RIY33139.1 hypothetical protein CKF54_03585 [Psittacicella hinzii]